MMSEHSSDHPILDVLHQALGGDEFSLVSIRPISAGASRVTSMIEVTRGKTPKTLVLQQDRAGAGLGAVTVETQVSVLAAASLAGVPLPKLVAWDSSGEALGAPFILAEFIAGETLPRKILRLEQLAGAREDFAADCGRILAALHQAPLASLAYLADVDQLEEVVSWIDVIGHSNPAFELAIAWLEENRPAAAEPVLVHGDFRNGNLIVDSGGIQAVLDWELAHLGDPIEDLAWLCLRAWRFGGSGDVGGMGDVAQLIAAYESASGRSVDRRAFLWWQVLGTLKWGSICQRQALVHLNGDVSSIEHAAIGRRVCETEYDLLGLIP